MHPAHVAVLGCLLAAAGAGGAAAQLLAVEPAAIAAGGKPLTIEVRRRDGRAFCAGSDCSPWVGASFTRLVRLPTRWDPGTGQTVLRADLGRLSSTWKPAPAPGDAVVLVVYVGARPISAPFRLPVVANVVPPPVQPRSSKRETHP